MQNFSDRRKSAPGKSPFISSTIRNLTPEEKLFENRAKLIIEGELSDGLIGIIPAFASQDGKQRDLVFSNEIANKIELGKSAHGKIPITNFIINANDWDYVIRNVKGESNKINLIKNIPKSHNFLVIGANKVNGYYIVTHFETRSKNGNQLKNLLLRGDVLDKFGRTPSP